MSFGGPVAASCSNSSLSLCQARNRPGERIVDAPTHDEI
jgi:hypothetical protein